MGCSQQLSRHGASCREVEVDTAAVVNADGKGKARRGAFQRKQSGRKQQEKQREGQRETAMGEERREKGEREREKERRENERMNK